MTNFSAKEIKQSIRLLQEAIDGILNATYATYKARIKSFVELTNSNHVLYSIIDPMVNLPLNFDEIHVSINGFWIRELNLPTNIDHRIAYVVQIFNGVAKKELSLEDLSYKIYKHQRYEDNILSYLSDVARPPLIELTYKLNDLIQDEVQGKEEVSSATLQIINHGTITAQEGSNIAMGHHIQQGIEYHGIAQDIMKKVKAENIVEEEKLPEVEAIAQEVEDEISKPEPSKSRLKQLAGKVVDIGEQGLLKSFTTVVSNPVWAQAVTENLLGM